MTTQIAATCPAFLKQAVASDILADEMGAKMMYAGHLLRSDTARPGLSLCPFSFPSKMRTMGAVLEVKYKRENKLLVNPSMLRAGQVRMRQLRIRVKEKYH